MKLFPLARMLLPIALVAAAVACDEEKKPAPTAPSATTAATTLALPSAKPSASAAPTAAPKRTKADCPTGAEVTFTSASLEAEVRKKIPKDAGPITKDDLKRVKSLNLTSVPMDDLDPCVFPLFTGMKDLFLGRPSELSDLSPIASLTGLITLVAAGTHVSDLKPLEKLVAMDRLDLGKTAVIDIKPIGNMAALTELQLDDTSVQDLSPLKSCTKLEKLHIQHTPVSDLSPLKDMKKLRFLYVEGAPITNLNVLDPLVNNGLKIIKTSK